MDLVDSVPCTTPVMSAPPHLKVVGVHADRAHPALQGLPSGRVALGYRSNLCRATHVVLCGWHWVRCHCRNPMPPASLWTEDGPEDVRAWVAKGALGATRASVRGHGGHPRHIPARAGHSAWGLTSSAVWPRIALSVGHSPPSARLSLGVHPQTALPTADTTPGALVPAADATSALSAAQSCAPVWGQQSDRKQIPPHAPPTRSTPGGGTQGRQPMPCRAYPRRPAPADAWQGIRRAAVLKGAAEGGAWGHCGRRLLADPVHDAGDHPQAVRGGPGFGVVVGWPVPVSRRRAPKQMQSPSDFLPSLG
mmetsp:Transcript_108052/g.186471  ORF Transcript_108052/g.186471 Transcript_108052/m.186471 type:complete len:307 (-) Transcript_108052:372-1292(-)